MERPISEVNYQNTYMMQYMYSCWQQIQNFGDRLMSLENRFSSEKCPNCGCQMEDSTPESEAWETESEDSDAGSELEQQGELPRPSSSVGSLGPGSTLDQLMSEVKQLNAFMGTVARSVTSIEDRFQAMEHSLQDQNTRLEGQENRLGIQKSTFEEEIRELKSQVSNSGNLGQVISQFTSVVTREQRLKSLEDQNKLLEDQVKELKDEISNLECQNTGLEFWIRRVDVQKKQLKDQNKNVEDQKRKMEERTSELQQQNKELEDQARKLQDQNSKQEEQIKGLKSEVQELKTKHSDSVTTRHLRQFSGSG